MTATAIGVRMPCLTRIQARSNPHRRLPFAESQMARRVCACASECTEARASKPVPNIHSLCRSRDDVLVHPIGKVTAITNLKVKHCNRYQNSHWKPSARSVARQGFKSFIAQSDGYLASFLSVLFAFSFDFFEIFASNLWKLRPNTNNRKLLIGFGFDYGRAFGFNESKASQ